MITKTFEIPPERLDLSVDPPVIHEIQPVSIRIKSIESAIEGWATFTVVAMDSEQADLNEMSWSFSCPIDPSWQSDWDLLVLGTADETQTDNVHTFLITSPQLEAVLH